MKTNNKIRMIDRVSDVALATIILGISMMVFGVSMIAGTTISMSHGYSLIDKTSSLLLFASMHGIGFIADGILLTVFCFFVATTHPLSIRIKALYIAGIVVVAYNAVSMILGLIFGTNGLGFVVSLTCVTIPCLIVALTRKLRLTAQQKIAPQDPVAVINLKKAG